MKCKVDGCLGQPTRFFVRLQKTKKGCPFLQLLLGKVPPLNPPNPKNSGCLVSFFVFSSGNPLGISSELLLRYGHQAAGLAPSATLFVAR